MDIDSKPTAAVQYRPVVARTEIRQMSDLSSSGLIAALYANGRAADRTGQLDLYGQFVGDWDADIVTYGPDGKRHQGQGEIHFGWVLEGRAIQDVWMIPRRKDRRPEGPIMP